MVTTDKIAMRRQFRSIREEYVASLSSQDKELAFSRPPSILKSLFTPDKTVAAYVAVGAEVDPLALLRFAYDAGCKTALPHVVSKASPMRFLAWSPGDQLELGPFHLRQPSAKNKAVIPDVILLPLIAFDRELSRLGQGAGHYDRALSRMENAIAIGVAWSVQEAELLITDSWDVPLDAVLTEKEWICT
jgi:5-formyltetrahydrofolate cyclo-ligase